MTDAPASSIQPAPDSLPAARAELLARTRRHADHCVLLAVVTSTDVSAALIDQAVELHANLRRVAAPA